MHSEHSFLFDPLISSNLNTVINDDNKSNIYGRHVRVRSGETITTGYFVYKRPDVYGTQEIKNYIKDTSYRDLDNDPYIELIRYFSDNKLKAMKLRAADFAYLKDIGVYPINRLWILRRYPDNVIVPDRPSDWGEGAIEPISTVVGWIKDDENGSMVELGFGEVWQDQTDMIDQVISKLMKDEFGQTVSNVMSIQGWGQGLLFGMLNAMGLTSEFSAENVPTGDPNVLRIAKMRPVEGQGLKTSFNFNLETSYEQKYINGIDPGQAFLDIVSNLLKMGTSDQRFILNSNKFLMKFQSVFINDAGNAKAWLDIALDFIKSFLNGLSDFFKQTKEIGEKLAISEDGSSGSAAANLFSGAISTILIGTVSKYRWPIRGSIALMTGMPSTPWHLTIGNPYSPIINMANIVVNDVKLKFSNDLGFNDLPVRIDVSVSAEIGRPLGKQEIEKVFNNGYKRVYSKTSIDQWAEFTQVNSNISPSGEATQNIEANKPNDLINKIEEANRPIPQLPNNNPPSPPIGYYATREPI